MTFLFGDSSPSDLRIDYVELLRDALDFSVQVLLADERMRQGLARVDEARRAGDAEGARLEALGSTLARAVEGCDVGAAESATAQCAHELLMRSSEVVRSAGERVGAQIAAEAARVEDEARRDRERCVEALGNFLKRHDLPNMTSEVRLQQVGGNGYAARLYLRGLEDLQAVMDLEVPAAHALAHVIKVEKLVERLEVHAPETGGWLRKEVKLRAQRLDKEHITAVVAGVHETTIHLRSSADGSGVGFDLVFRDDSPSVSLRRVGEATELPPFDLDETDSAKARELRANLTAATAELTRFRKGLVEAMLGGTPLYDHRDPRLMVERLVAQMAPVVREIAKRSLTKTELILKRQTGDGRREEIFVSRSDLQNKLRPLTEKSRAVFKPLELGEVPATDLAPTPAPIATPVPLAKLELAKSDSSKSDSSRSDNGSRSEGVKSDSGKGDTAKGEISSKSDNAARLKKSLFAEGGSTPQPTELNTLRVDSARLAPPPPPLKLDEVVALDDSLDRLIVSDAALKAEGVPKPK